MNSFSNAADLTTPDVPTPGAATSEGASEGASDPSMSGVSHDRVSEPEHRPDPFAAMPRARRVAVTYVAGVAAMIAVLSLIGYVITSTAAMSALRDWDESISEDVAAGRTDGAVDLALFITKTGDTLPIIALILAVSVVLAFARKWRAILFLPMAMGAEISTFLAVNHIVGRERPDVEKLGPLPGTFSFPSGHVAATFVCWVGISLLLFAYGWRRSAMVVAAFGALAGVAMAWARVYVGMHHTVDVIFGLAMGAAALVLTVIVLRVNLSGRRDLRSVRGPSADVRRRRPVPGTSS